jgi:hypothetical protein
MRQPKYGWLWRLAAMSAVVLGSAAAWAAEASETPIPPPPGYAAAAPVRTTVAPLAAPTDGADVSAPVAPPEARSKPLAAPAADAFTLPSNCHCPDGTVAEDVIVAHQRKRLDAINSRLKTQLRLTETPHYLLFCDADPAVGKQFADWSEALYGNLCKEFGLDSKQQVWNGKCLLIVFASRSEFEAFARAFDTDSAQAAGAYFAWERYGPSQPSLVHICIPADNKPSRQLQELFAHEGTHAFFQLYHKAAPLPLWLHEGLAEYMTVVNDPSLMTRKVAPARAAARQQANIAGLFKHGVREPLSRSEYAISYTLVDYLQKSGRAKFLQFVDLLKDGKDQDAALKAVYGFDTTGLADRWRAALTGESAPARARAA